MASELGTILMPKLDSCWPGKYRPAFDRPALFELEWLPSYRIDLIGEEKARRTGEQFHVNSSCSPTILHSYHCRRARELFGSHTCEAVHPPRRKRKKVKLEEARPGDSRHWEIWKN